MDSNFLAAENAEQHRAAEIEETVTAGTLSDVATDKDELGFAVYAQSIATFLMSDDTKPPLTLSIEGEWGSGKTSFMKQIAKHLVKYAQKENKPQPIIFWFDGWRSDKDEGIWASFALQFLRHLAEPAGFMRKALGAIRLDLQRFDKNAAVFALLRTAGVWVVFALLLAVISLRGNFGIPGIGLVRIPWAGLVLVGLGLVSSGYAALMQTRKLVNPVAATIDLLKFVRAPDYAAKRSFSDVFAEDLPRIIKAYVPQDKRVFVFIDDIDRSDIGAAADLIHGLMLLVSTEQPQLVSIVGLDRQKVAAGIAVKNERLLPYLYPYAELDTKLLGLAYGYEFLEKFFQLPFLVPKPSRDDITAYIRSFSKGITTPSGNARDRDDDLRRIAVALKNDSDLIRNIVLLVSPVLGENPRRIKQFVNLLRLRAFIASETGVLGHRLSLEQLGIIVAFWLRWPRLLDRAQQDGEFLADLQERARFEQEADEEDEWLSKPELVNLLRTCAKDRKLSLVNLDLEKFFQTSPAYIATRQRVGRSQIPSTEERVGRHSGFEDEPNTGADEDELEFARRSDSEGIRPLAKTASSRRRKRR